MILTPPLRSRAMRLREIRESNPCLLIDSEQSLPLDQSPDWFLFGSCHPDTLGAAMGKPLRNRFSQEGPPAYGEIVSCRLQHTLPTFWQLELVRVYYDQLELWLSSFHLSIFCFFSLSGGRRILCYSGPIS